MPWRRRMKNSLDETLRINKLFEIYGRLLTSSQREIMNDYYQNNLSLGEIAEIRNTSRSAISDAINKSIDKLTKYEKELRLCALFEEEIEKSPNQKEYIEHLLERIKDGI